MGDSPYQQLGLKRVINASGKMTALGGSAQHFEVADALRDAAQHHVELRELRDIAGYRVAERAGAEAACITTGAAAGIAVGVAAMITGNDEQAVRKLPRVDGLADEIVLQSGHDVDFGALVTQMVGLGGGRPVVAGNTEGVTVDQLQEALSDRTAGLLFVQSHHTRQAAGVTLAEMIGLGRRCGIPVLVDAAAEENLSEYVAAGADLVTYSGGKAIGGPTVGFIVGSRALIEACELQNIGIARAMKVGKEQVMGLLAALDRYPGDSGWPDRLQALFNGLSGIPGISISVEDDLAGRNIRRVGLSMSSNESLEDLVRHLHGGDPAIYTRNHQLKDGLLLFDVREVAHQDIDVIISRVSDFVTLNV